MVDQPGRPAGGTRGRRFAPVVGLAAVLLVAACGENIDVSGIWTNGNEQVQLRNPGRPGPHYLEGAYIQLVLGQYGKEVAGGLKVYDSPNFLLAYVSCSLVLSGGVSGDTVTFSFNVYAPGVDPAVMIADLRLRTGDDRPVLAGPIRLDGEEAAYAWLTLKGQSIRQMWDDLKRCVPGPPAEWDAGGGAGDAGR